MRRPVSSLQRSMHLLLAVLALLCGTGAHELLHGSEVVRGGPAPVAPFEAHDSECQHLGDAPLHVHSSGCLFCKSGGIRHAALPPCAPHAAPVGAPRLLFLAGLATALPAPTPGSVGARAPPVHVG